MNRRFTFNSQCSSAHARGRVSDTDPARLITTQTLMTDSIHHSRCLFTRTGPCSVSGYVISSRCDSL